jgi:hypothetical protein
MLFYVGSILLWIPFKCQQIHAHQYNYIVITVKERSWFQSYL